MDQREEIIFGRVVTNGEVFFLLSPKPEHKTMWQLESTLRWLVAPYKSQELSGDSVSYRAAYIIFGSDAIVQLWDNPDQKIFVDYFSSDDDDNVVVSPI